MTGAAVGAVGAVELSPPWRLLLFLLASLSIASLLLYFSGAGSLAVLAPALLAVEAAGLTVIAIRSLRGGPAGASRLIAAGLWSGCVATAAYDAVRLPLVHGGLPVFQAISYFGMVLSGTGHPTTASELIGWGYHLSNGVSFGLMYAAVARRPNVIGAVVWGLLLEGTMLLTPYAEVFGYARNVTFLTITLTSHAIYGAVLWLALRRHARTGTTARVAALAGVAVVLVALAIDFRHLHGGRLPAPPPARLGRHLYTCWSSPEPDRVVVLWLMKRYADPAAEFYFIDPFEKIRFGTPLDVPEAAIRRQDTRSASEVLVSRYRIPVPARMESLVRTTHVVEVVPWTMIADRPSAEMAADIRRLAAASCGARLRTSCLRSLFAGLDELYEGTAQ